MYDPLIFPQSKARHMSNIAKNIEKPRHQIVCRDFFNFQNCLSLRNYTIFFILNGNLNPASEDYRAAFLINADVIDQTTPQFFPELRLFSRQIFQFGDEVREYLLRVILLLDESFQFLKAAMLFTVHQAHYNDKNTPPKRGANILNCVYLCMSTLVPDLNSTLK